MTTITREWLLQTIAEYEANRDELPFGLDTNSAIELQAFKIALASLGAEKIAEPVAKVKTVGVCWYADNGVPRKPAVGTELYTAPPAPVDNTFIPKNLDRALGVVGVALPESKEEFNFQIERWIQRLIDRVIRYSDEFKEQTAQPDIEMLSSALRNAPLAPSDSQGRPRAPVVPDEMTMADAIMEIDAKDADRWTGRIGFQKGWNACRAAMLNQEKING